MNRILTSLFGLSASMMIATSASAASQNLVFKNAKGEEVGTATLTELAKGVKIQLDLKGLSAGEHAFHVHENGKCEAPKFESAGGHYAPAKKSHGFDDAKGPHAGDMPNLIVGADGTLKQEVVNTTVTMKPGKTSLFKKGGTSLIVHEKADDYKSQPAGDAGGRAACAEIQGS